MNLLKEAAGGEAVESEEDLARLTAARSDAEALLDEPVVLETDDLDDLDDDPREAPVPA